MKKRETFKIWTYGDSLAQPREGIVSDAERYLTLILSWFSKNYGAGARLYEHSKGGSTIVDLFNWYRHDMSYYNGEDKDILIIQCGICDCAPRIEPLKLRAYINRLPKRSRDLIIKTLKKSKQIIQKKGIYWRRVRPNKFYSTLEKWLIRANSEFGRIYVFNIAPKLQ